MNSKITIGKYDMYHPTIQESNFYFTRITDCRTMDTDNRLTMDGYDLYLIPQHSQLFTSYVDLMAEFGANTLVNTPKFFARLSGQEVSVSMFPDLPYKAYLCPKYSYPYDVSIIDRLNKDMKFFYRNWGTRRPYQHGSSYMNDFILWLREEQKEPFYDDGILESLDTIWRVASLMHSNIMPSFRYENFRSDSKGNLVLFNILKRGI